MRYHIVAGAFAALATSTAIAQEAPQHTLDAQMQQMQQEQQEQQAAAPIEQYKKATAEQYYRKTMPSAGTINSLGGGAIPALPLEIRTVGDVRYLTGGVGDEEIEQLKAVENEYSFQLLITGVAGAFISDAVVRILDEKDQVILSTDGAGPYLYATLPPGSYKLEVTAVQGGLKTATVKVPASGAVKPVLRFTE